MNRSGENQKFKHYIRDKADKKEKNNVLYILIYLIYAFMHTYIIYIYIFFLNKIEKRKQIQENKNQSTEPKFRPP